MYCAMENNEFNGTFNICLIDESIDGRSYSALLNSIRLCNQYHIDILSLSVGSLSRLTARDYYDSITCLGDTLVVSAAANNFNITYPASLSTVLGVKMALKNCDDTFIEQCNPPDGIELIANLPEPELLCIISNMYGVYYSNSNSVTQADLRISPFDPAVRALYHLCTAMRFSRCSM